MKLSRKFYFKGSGDLDGWNAVKRLYVKHEGIWRPPIEGYKKVNGKWELFYQLGALEFGFNLCGSYLTPVNLMERFKQQTGFREEFIQKIPIQITVDVCDGAVLWQGLDCTGFKHANCSIIIKNRGYILGRAGKGADAEFPYTVVAEGFSHLQHFSNMHGFDGEEAIKAECDVVIHNWGTILGGGGGGAAGMPRIKLKMGRLDMGYKRFQGGFPGYWKSISAAQMGRYRLSKRNAGANGWAWGAAPADSNGWTIGLPPGDTSCWNDPWLSQLILFDVQHSAPGGGGVGFGSQAGVYSDEITKGMSLERRAHIKRHKGGQAIQLAQSLADAGWGYTTDEIWQNPRKVTGAESLGRIDVHGPNLWLDVIPGFADLDLVRKWNIDLSYGGRYGYLFMWSRMWSSGHGDFGNLQAEADAYFPDREKTLMSLITLERSDGHWLWPSPARGAHWATSNATNIANGAMKIWRKGYLSQYLKERYLRSVTTSGFNTVRRCTTYYLCPNYDGMWIPCAGGPRRWCWDERVSSWTKTAWYGSSQKRAYDCYTKLDELDLLTATFQNGFLNYRHSNHYTIGKEHPTRDKGSDNVGPFATQNYPAYPAPIDAATSINSLGGYGGFVTAGGAMGGMEHRYDYDFSNTSPEQGNVTIVPDQYAEPGSTNGSIIKSQIGKTITIEANKLQIHPKVQEYIDEVNQKSKGCRGGQYGVDGEGYKIARRDWIARGEHWGITDLYVPGGRAGAAVRSTWSRAADGNPGHYSKIKVFNYGGLMGFGTIIEDVYAEDRSENTRYVKRYFRTNYLAFGPEGYGQSALGDGEYGEAIGWFINGIGYDPDNQRSVSELRYWMMGRVQPRLLIDTYGDDYSGKCRHPDIETLNS